MSKGGRIVSQIEDKQGSARKRERGVNDLCNRAMWRGRRSFFACLFIPFQSVECERARGVESTVEKLPSLTGEKKESVDFQIG